MNWTVAIVVTLSFVAAGVGVVVYSGVDVQDLQEIYDQAMAEPRPRQTSDDILTGDQLANIAFDHEHTLDSALEPDEALPSSEEDSSDQSKVAETDDSKPVVDPKADPLDAEEAYLRENPRDRIRAQKFGAALVEGGHFNRAESFFKWRLEVSPNDHIWWYHLGWNYENAKRWADAIAAYEQAANSRNHIAKNNLAWLLSTAPDESLRDGKRALMLAERAIEMQGGRTRALADTLAAAYAEFGDFQSAIETQEWVVNRSPESERSELEERLELYRQGKPYRQPQ